MTEYWTMPSLMQSAKGYFGYALTRLGVMLSHPGAFAIALIYGLLWATVHPQSLDWHGGVTLAALFMTLFIQRAAHRDTQALHAKLDELLRVQVDARDELTTVDEEEPENIERRREGEKSLRSSHGK
jgi:low affinity Fe/Cu permease